MPSDRPTAVSQAESTASSQSAGEYDDVALVVSRRSNELSEHENWYYLDTLALAEFRAGNARKAVELQQRVLQLSGGEGDQGALQRSLNEYRASVDVEDASVVLGDAR